MNGDSKRTLKMPYLPAIQEEHPYLRPQIGKGRMRGIRHVRTLAAEHRRFERMLCHVAPVDFDCTIEA